MTPELTQRLDSILSYLETTAKATGDFTLEQAPLVAQEIINWGIAQAIGIIVVTGALMVACLLACHWSLKQDNDDITFFTSLLSGIVSLVSFITFIYSVFTLLKIIFAPRLYLIEYVSNLLS